MRICIHRGTQEIGGTCVEIESQGKRLVLDVGLPLDVVDPDTFPLHPISGFAGPDDSLLGVVISHPHQDHYGLAHRLPKETTFLIGKAAEAILSAAGLFSPGGVKLDNTLHLDDRKPIKLGPFTATPFLVDHSAYDSYAVLVEADDKRLFYSGDFRAHGRKSSLFEKLIANPPPGVDVLLMEGTCIGRADSDRGFPTEADLESRFVDLFGQTTGMALAWCSGQNIDRVVTVFRACKQTGRQFIIDMYTAEILRATGNERIPQADWKGIRVFLPASQKRRIIQEKAFDVSNSYRPYRIFPEQLAEAAPKSVMLFRPSMVRDLEAANCLEGAVVICSVWAGLLDEPSNQRFIAWVQDRGIPLHRCHTSGHASVADLRRLRDAFPAAVVVPVHLADREGFAILFNDVELHGDGEWWEVKLRRKRAMPSDGSASRLKEIDGALGLHEIIASVRQLSYMKQHCTALLRTLNVHLEITYAKAPVGRRGRGQTYELQRTERAEAQMRERLLEKLIWKQWSFGAVAKNGKPFLAGVCSFMQSYQVPLQGTRRDKKWGRIDLVGATPKALPVVVELKQEKAGDTPLRMLVEAVAYACAVRRAWNEGGLRAEWVAAMKKNGLTPDVPNTLTEVPVILVAPADFWKAKVGVPRKRSSGKVRDDAWPPFLDLVRQFTVHGLPIHFVQFEVADPGPTITSVSVVWLPGGDQDSPGPTC